MISNKKSHAMKMLQLALALSLLHVDPEHFLEQRLLSWDSGLELADGDGWELEMLRAVPVVEYPYANRKTMMPLIEDLVRLNYDIHHESSHSPYSIEAYLLNVQGESTNQTAAVQELQITSPSPSLISTTSTSSSNNVVLEQVASASALSGNNSGAGIIFPDSEMFLSMDSFQDQRSVWEQNLADLNDFGDIAIGQSLYSGLPLKEEPQDNTYIDINLDVISLGGAFTECGETVEEGAVALNDTFPNPADTTAIKIEESASNDFNQSMLLSDIPSCSSGLRSAFGACKINDDVKIKREEVLGKNMSDRVDLSPFINHVELSKEESEIVDVLWKQDVDLGYSLSQSLADNTNEGEHQSKDQENESMEDLEKITLKDLKEDKLKFDSSNDENLPDDIRDEWAGINFTIDNETGEYIRLPLDELLNDVLQLAELAGDNNEIQTDSISSNAVDNSDNNNIAENKIKDYDTKDEDKENNNCKSESELSDLPQSEIEVTSLPSPLFDLDDEAKEELEKMIQSTAPSFHHHHHHSHRSTLAGVPNYAVGGGANSAFHRQTTGFHHGHHQGRMPISRGVSMEQRLQDIASLFNPIPSMGEMSPYPHYPTHHYSYQSPSGISTAAQHGQYPPPPHHHGHHAMLHPNTTLGDICSAQSHYGHNLGSAVASSMHLTNSSHEADVGAAGASAYKMEHDMMYYSNASSDMNHTTDGFINSILNDEDLHLMDMNVNDNFCRMVDVNNSTSNNSSVLGISSAHPGGSSVSNSSNGVNMPSGSGGGTGVMSSDLMASAGAQGGTDRLDASSDSAVSSMGSERVPSLSDGEWGEGSDSAQDYHQSKYGGPYDYSYNNTNNNSRINDATRQPPVAQKKHQMFGKRFLHEQPGSGSAAAAGNELHSSSAGVGSTPIKYEYEPYPTMPNLHQNNGISQAEIGAIGPAIGKDHHAYELKYGAGTGGSYSLDFSLRTPRTPHDIVQHNHTYALPQGTGSLPRPQQRDKKLSTSSSKSSTKHGELTEEEHLTRDEKRARSLNIPIAVTDIINLPMDEFNERLSKYDLTENQLSLIRDIRRRGKNKVAAQNCRKRKLDQILSLEDEVKEVRRRKDQLNRERDGLAVERKRISNKFASLHRHIFQYLRDPEGNQCSPSEYSLQQAADGSIYLLPRDGNNKSDSTVASSNGATSVISHIGAAPGMNGHSTPVGHQSHLHIAASSHRTANHQQQQALQAVQQQQQHVLSQANTNQLAQPTHTHAHHHQPHQKD